ncbi:hypothetical protein Q7689_00940 [Nocardiopsis tropica]|uniref:hypothetical protein n=1 Tax=Nocardiopsis tropica TaxID=109330 RepID=UPI002E844937|nr:hypothetical protein [Nocardiopsis tropica]
MKTVLELRELENLAALRTWARAHGAQVRYMGTTGDHEEMFGARRGAQLRVCRAPYDPCRVHPVIWRSPLETLPAP